MHTQSRTTRHQRGRRNQPIAHPPDLCGFGLCKAPATRAVTTRTAIGRRVERLCDPHAQRRHELEQVLADEPIVSVEPKPALDVVAIETHIVAFEDLLAMARATAIEPRCPACGEPYSSPDYAQREHWGA